MRSQVRVQTERFGASCWSEFGVKCTLTELSKSLESSKEQLKAQPLALALRATCLADLCFRGQKGGFHGSLHAPRPNKACMAQQI